MTVHNVTVRPASIEDHKQISRLMELADGLHRDGAPWLFKVPDVAPWTDRYWAELLAREDARVSVAAAEQVVGVAVARLRAAPGLPIFRQQRWCVLDSLVVEPTWRRRGMGKLLVRAVERWAAESGAPWVELNVYEFNAEARRFYQALGYLPYSTRLRKPTAGSS